MLIQHRIQQGRGRAEGGGQLKRRQQPVLLHRGVLTANNDFDVWIANTRGTWWSRRHASS
ncbi:hypothetical protein C4D60_Mb10t02490 [Musa balbisiana]|uniref:Uncharacterized protein n=1 Tax=Musa balbisiana TaxID=52838 RepID=A0A4V6T464_MUSBA|nr:hypothetical protein C4D60_Mb10t02490 [Musa balbisiana]